MRKPRKPRYVEIGVWGLDAYTDRHLLEGDRSVEISNGEDHWFPTTKELRRIRAWLNRAIEWKEEGGGVESR